MINMIVLMQYVQSNLKAPLIVYKGIHLFSQTITVPHTTALDMTFCNYIVTETVDGFSQSFSCCDYISGSTQVQKYVCKTATHKKTKNGFSRPIIP